MTEESKGKQSLPEKESLPKTEKDKLLIQKIDEKIDPKISDLPITNVPHNDWLEENLETEKTKMKKNPIDDEADKLSLAAIPCYNEEKTIGSVVLKAKTM